jgi:hypothetical protein
VATETGAASATPIAASSGSHPKAPGSAGGAFAADQASARSRCRMPFKGRRSFSSRFGRSGS